MMSEYFENNGMNQENVPPVTPFSMGSSSSYYAPPQGSGAPKKQRKKGAGKIVALALCCSLVGGAVGAGGVYAATRLTGANATSASAASTILEGERAAAVLNVAQIDTSKVMTPAEVYAANVNSTVGITTSITTNWWGYQTTSAASGSGFILTEDGYILTNYHVIEGSSSITVTLYDDTSYEATLVGYDESNDIAVLKVDATGLAPVVLGDSDDLNVGDTVVAIGNPLGELTFSLTQGAVSALNRQVTLSSDLTMDLIQTDCAINSGNSGGALFNLYGEVIGITNAKYSSSGSSSEASIDNIGFAIPINSVRSIVQSIIEKGYISKPYIGVYYSDVDEKSQAYGLPQGASIESVVEGSAAETAGLQANDIITAVNDTQITCGSDLADAVGAVSPGDVLTLTVYRQGQTIQLTLTVGEQIQSALAEDNTQSSSQQQQQQQQQSSTFPWGNFGFGY
jgi:serine protease Do